MNIANLFPFGSNTPQLAAGMLYFLIFISFLIPSILANFIEIDPLIWAVITHGRSDIWFSYVDLLRHSSLSNILFGFRGGHLPDVVVWGGALYNNPHSSYFRIFLSCGVFVYLFFFCIFYYKIKNIENKKAIFIVLAIMIAAITNVNVFFNDNPVYLITFFVFSQNSLQQVT